ncbi:MAG: hypothetical protein KJO29_05675 [Bacteroidia bacterium]|nr:hypothetical protein [Bacteroidia bacterium]
MPIAQTELLFKLIKSLDKAEKRNFKLFVKRLASNKDGLFLRLFELIDKSKEPDDAKYQQSLAITKQNQYSNLKRHLYSQIIKSLRLNHIEKEEVIKIREQMDHATVLYGKGLYDQCLLLLERIKTLAKGINNNLLLLQILELQKKIESRHITRSRKIKNRIENLVEESARTREIISRTSALSDLSLNVQGMYIKYGFAKSDRDLDIYKSYFESHKPEYNSADASFYEKVLWHQSHVWYAYMCLDFKSSMDAAMSWVNEFHKEEDMKTIDPDLYMRGLHYVMTNAYYRRNKNIFETAFDSFTDFRMKNLDTFKMNSRIFDFVYFGNARLNTLFIHNNFEGLSEIESDILENIDRYNYHLDSHRIIMFYYKLAMAFMHRGNYSTALDYWNTILSNNLDPLRSDIYCYSRLLHLLCHYSLNSFDLVENIIQSVKNAFHSYGHMNKTLELFFSFIRKGCRAMNFGLNQDMEELKSRLLKLTESRYELIPFQYFDFNLWLDSQIMNTSIEKTISLSGSKD